MIIVEKPFGSLRVCRHPKDLKKAIIRPHYLMRMLEDESDGLKPDPSKVSAIYDMDEPCNCTMLETLLGMINHLSKFAPNLAEVTSPLRCLLAKDVAFACDESQANAFDKLRKSSEGHQGLSHMTKPLTVQVDA